MPVVRVAFYEGRSPEKKREVAEAITDALVRVCGGSAAVAPVAGALAARAGGQARSCDTSWLRARPPCVECFPPVG